MLETLGFRVPEVVLQSNGLRFRSGLKRKRKREREREREREGEREREAERERERERESERERRGRERESDEARGLEELFEDPKGFGKRPMARSETMRATGWNRRPNHISLAHPSSCSLNRRKPAFVSGTKVATKTAPKTSTTP